MPSRPSFALCVVSRPWCGDNGVVMRSSDSWDDSPFEFIAVRKLLIQTASARTHTSLLRDLPVRNIVPHEKFINVVRVNIVQGPTVFSLAESEWGSPDQVRRVSTMQLHRQHHLFRLVYLRAGTLSAHIYSSIPEFTIIQPLTNYSQSQAQ
jgi:hypothetical protein